MAASLKAFNPVVPYWLIAPVIPTAAFYLFAFLMYFQGWETMGQMSIYAWRSLYFWVFYVAPIAILIGALGAFFPRQRRRIEWWSFSILFLVIYILTPRISS